MSPEPSACYLTMQIVELMRETRPWTTSELAVMRDNAARGAEVVAELLGRSVASVRQAAHRNRISLRKHGSRKGLVLGQPRGVSLRSEIRDGLVRDRRDELLERRAQADADAELCPCCGRRPARTRSGFCVPCTTDRLTEAYEEMTADAAAMRRLWAARQRRRSQLDHLDAEGIEAT